MIFFIYDSFKNFDVNVIDVVVFNVVIKNGMISVVCYENV